MKHYNWREQAEELINYYEELSVSQGSKWTLGLFMAKHWLSLLDQPQHDLDELRLFVQALEAERPNQGSSWGQMWSLVWIWVEEVKEQCPEG